MAITFASQPGLRSFSKNPIKFAFSTDNYVTTPGVKASKVFRVFPELGETFTIEWGNESVTFTAVSGAPDDSGLQIVSYPIPFSYVDFALLPTLQANDKIFASFYVTAIAVGIERYIKIEALETGEDFDLTITSDAVSFPLEINSTVTGVDQAVRENFKIVAELMLYNAARTSYESVIILEQTPDINSSCEFSFEQYLDASLSVDLPVYASTVMTPAPNMVKKYFVRVHEKYGLPSVDYKVTWSTDKYVLFGGVKSESWPTSAVMSNQGQTQKTFLSWQPLEKEVAYYEMAYLYYFFTNSQISSLKLKVLVYFSDDTTGEVTKTLASPTQELIYIVPTGFTQLNLSALETSDKKVVKYELWMANHVNDQISEIRTYIVDRNYYTKERFLYYRNSLSGMDSIRIVEEAQSSAEISSEVSEKILPLGYVATTGQKEKINISYEEAVTVGTGMLEREFKRALFDLFITKDTFELLSSLMISIEVLNKSEVIYDEADDLHPGVISYKYNYTNTGYNL